MVCVGQVGQSLSHQKHRSTLTSSFLFLSVTSFPCHLCCLTSYRTLDSRCRLRRFFTFFLGITSTSSVTQTRSGYSSRSYKSYPFAYATASFVSLWRPTLSARSSKSHTIFIAGSLLWYWLTATFIFVSLYSVSMERSPLSPLLLLFMNIMWTVDIQMKWRCDHRSCDYDLSNRKLSAKDVFGASTGFDPRASAFALQCSTNGAMKTHTLGAGQFVEFIVPVKGMKHMNIMRTADIQMKWWCDHRSCVCDLSNRS